MCFGFLEIPFWIHCFYSDWIVGLRERSDLWVSLRCNIVILGIFWSPCMLKFEFLIWSFSSTGFFSFRFYGFKKIKKRQKFGLDGINFWKNFMLSTIWILQFGNLYCVIFFPSSELIYMKISFLNCHFLHLVFMGMIFLFILMLGHRDKLCVE